MRQPFLRFILGAACSLMIGCGGGGGDSGGGVDASDGSCDGSCAHQVLTEAEVAQIVQQAVSVAKQEGTPATIAVVDRVGNVLALYQMAGAPAAVRIDGLKGAQGGLEGAQVPATLGAIAKAVTGAYLSSQGNAFSTRTASQIIQENFNPGEQRQPGGPLFGVQYSQLPCGDLVGSNIGHPTRGPKPSPLGLSADPGGIPLYKSGDLVGGIGIEADGAYVVDRSVADVDSDIDEILAVTASRGFEAPRERRAERMSVGGKSLRYLDSSGVDLPPALEPLDASRFVAQSPFFGGTLRGGVQYGTAESGISISGSVASLVGVGIREGSTNGIGQRLLASDVQALLGSVQATADRVRAAIRRPLDTRAQVSISVVDLNGTLLGFSRSADAPVFGIDVSLQKARTAAFFSGNAREPLVGAGFGGYVSGAQALTGAAFNGDRAWTSRAVGNVARPFFPDGVNSNPHGPFSLPIQNWSPFNNGLQLDIVLGRLVAGLGSSRPLRSCSTGALGSRIPNGIQIFAGSVPLYKSGSLVGAVGVSGDGIDQDDLIAYFGSSRAGLDFNGHTQLGDATLGFNAPRNLRIDAFATSVENTRLRYVNCPEAPFSGSNEQRVCE